MPDRDGAATATTATQESDKLIVLADGTLAGPVRVTPVT